MAEIVISTAITGSVEQFIDYGLVIVALLLMWYIVKFFLIGAPTAEEKERGWAERGRLWREWFGERKKHLDAVKENQKKKRELVKAAEERRSLLEPARGFLVRTVEQVDDALESAGEKDKFDNTESLLGKIENNLRAARRTLRARMHHRLMAEHREYIRKLFEYVDVIEKSTMKNALDAMPKDEKDRQFDGKMKRVKSALAQVRTQAGLAIESIDKFIQQDQAEINAAVAEHEQQAREHAAAAGQPPQGVGRGGSGSGAGAGAGARGEPAASSGRARRITGVRPVARVRKR